MFLEFCWGLEWRKVAYSELLSHVSSLSNVWNQTCFSCVWNHSISAITLHSSHYYVLSFPQQSPLVAMDTHQLRATMSSAQGASDRQSVAANGFTNGGFLMSGFRQGRAFKQSGQGRVEPECCGHGLKCMPVQGSNTHVWLCGALQSPRTLLRWRSERWRTGPSPSAGPWALTETAQSQASTLSARTNQVQDKQELSL